MNRLTTELTRICREKLLAEKWLLTPSLRAGHQWLSTVVHGGQPALNVHVKTLTNLALHLAGPRLAADGLQLISSLDAALLIDRIMHRLRKPASGYLWQLPPSAGLAKTVYTAIEAIRHAGLGPDELGLQHFEVSTKGKELADILETYLRELRRRQLVDRADVFRLAIEHFHHDPSILSKDLLLLVPDDLECRGLEKALVEVCPKQQIINLPVDQLQEPAAKTQTGLPVTDATFFRWLASPVSAPPPVQDGTASIFRAAGEANEVREVLRQCLQAGYPLDQVEILYTDSDTYVPLIYETMAALMAESDDLADIPATFHEGIPVRFFRPGRALSAWLRWVGEDFPQSQLVQMIQEGMLDIPGQNDEQISFTRLAGVFRTIGIGWGLNRYVHQLEEHEKALVQQIASANIEDEEGEIEPGKVAKLQRRLEAVRVLGLLVQKLIPISTANTGTSLIDSARFFLETMARTAVKLDNYAKEKLVIEIREMQECLAADRDPVSVDPRDWLIALPASTRVGGSGPRSGCLHVASIHNGGHSGRPHIFIVGMDDARFPGAGLQDPILLDSERRGLSAHLSTAEDRLKERQNRFVRLLARQRGTISLSYSCHDAGEDREMFPSPAVLAAFRILSGRHDGDQAALDQWLPEVASFAPNAAGKILDQTDWWLWQLTGQAALKDSEALIGKCYPHLSRGFEAARSRQGDDFTIYDGHISLLDKRHDPASPVGPVVSASRLEKLGSCPLAYFFKYILEIEPPEEIDRDAGRWLDAATFGSLLHAVFEKFLRELIEENKVPDYIRDENRLLSILADKVAYYRTLIPSASEAIFRQECRRLQAATRIFLMEEQEYCRKTGCHPIFLEASIGLKSNGNGSMLDSSEPVSVVLSTGKRFRVQGRIDRIDHMGDEPTAPLAIWDYKTGSAYKFRQKPPFWEGRIVQHVIYLEMVKARLKELGEPYCLWEIGSFGFFFPAEKQRGERIIHTATQLSGGGQLLDGLIGIAASGSFLSTNNQDDCKYCDYQGVCGDVASVTDSSDRKLENTDNVTLQPFLILRKHVET